MKPANSLLLVFLAAWIGHADRASGLESSKGPDYKPPQFANAENHLRVRFLPEARDWERLDVYVPKAAREAKLPCIVFFYGGGWGGKVMWDRKNTQTLLDHGYVVAVPDYVLGAQNPVPVTVWDGAAAIRFLRANAAKYQIDPERIGVVGLSAGGWLVQYLVPSDSNTLWGNRVWGTRDRSGPMLFTPMMEPHPENADQSPTVQAFVTDWGAGKLAKDGWNMADPKAWLGPNDPPLFTCGPMPDTFVPEGVRAYRAAGAIAELATAYRKLETGEVVADVKNANDYGHCLVGVVEQKYLTKDKTSKEIRFGERTLQFLDEYLKNPRTASAPEILPHGGPILGPTAIRLRTIHPSGKIHYTLDGSEPTEKSPIYERPLKVKPGDTVKAIAIRPGLNPSAVAAALLSAAPCPPPVITRTEQVYRAKVKQPFSLTFKAACDQPVTWNLSGKVLAQTIEAIDPNVDNTNKKREAPWLTLDRDSGVLSGTPSAPGVSVFIISANVIDGQTVLCDARSVIIVAE